MVRHSVARHLTTFVLPLVQGKRVYVGAPISPPALEAMQRELDSAVVEQVAVDDARIEVASLLVCRPPQLILEAEDLSLTAGLYNALAAIHPGTDSVLVTEKQRRRVLDAALTMVSQPLTHSRQRVLGRHALFHNLFQLERMDTTVSWWTGSARFLGQSPPHRLTSWRSVRRVQEDVIVTGFEELLGTAETSPVVATLLRRSPLTQLLGATRAAPPLHWEDAVFVLRDVELARAVAYRLMPEAPSREHLLGLARLSAAFEQMLERAPARADVCAVAAFLCHVNALLCLAEIHLREPNAKSPLVAAALATDSAGQRPRGLATLLALPQALSVVEPALAEPPGLGDEPRLLARWQAHRAQVVETLGRPVIDALVGRLARHFAAVETLSSAGATG
ncbi:MAG: hypothetical protein IPI49_24600 [Myxococcales bacterium]|nr:hypothetical protein [Myxococcales bacterium]